MADIVQRLERDNLSNISSKHTNGQDRRQRSQHHPLDDGNSNTGSTESHSHSNSVVSGVHSSSEEEKPQEEHRRHAMNTTNEENDVGERQQTDQVSIQEVSVPSSSSTSFRQQEGLSSAAAASAAILEDEDDESVDDEKKMEQDGSPLHEPALPQTSGSAMSLRKAPEPPSDKHGSEEEKMQDDDETALRSTNNDDMHQDPPQEKTKPNLMSSESWIPGNENDNDEPNSDNFNPNSNNNQQEDGDDCKKSWASDAHRKAILRSGGANRQTVKRKGSNASWNPDDADSAAACGSADTGRSHTTPLKSRMPNKKLSLNGKVHFSHVHIREYNVCIGDNPCCSYGPPISLDWQYDDDGEDIPIDVYETHHVIPRAAMKRRSRRTLVLSYNERKARLWKAGYTLEEIEEAAQNLEREKWRQSVLGNLEALYRIEEIWVLHIKPRLFRKHRHKNGSTAGSDDLDTLEERVREEHSLSRASSVASRDLSLDDDDEDDDDVESGGSAVVVIEGLKSLSDENEASSSKPSSKERRSGSGEDDDNRYSIKVDRKQQDKACEIRLRSFARPHMRAFHASWFSFFVAFFAWFSISPLLSEIKETLHLSRSDIWTSSLCATAGTVVMRIIMGPLCDKFGSRICMAMILIVAAVPTALTGLVQTSAGLSLVRLFIGIGGSSFVACQYWTSEMFTREVAGTANAMVAGWGNLGGGVTNVVMGSVLFPLFQLFYDDEEEPETAGFDVVITTREEQAWRTVFIVPALLAFFTAIGLLFYCDDSPKGSYRARIKNEQMTVINPRESFEAAARNRNVWVLCVQYACCFGIEVTMTNATASYFTEEFGQSTVSAAAIASIFGFMNLWARGLGGLISDTFQNRFGINGRLFWQILTLTLEGAGVIIFGFAESFAWSIIALVYMSIMVQSAEGSTFGIVPYVDRRYTGSVVGIIGAGGNVGGVVFAVFFRQFSNNTAFTLMGMSAVASALFSCFMNTSKLEQRYATADIEHEHVLELEKKSQSDEQSEFTRRNSIKSEPSPPNCALETLTSFHSESKGCKTARHHQPEEQGSPQTQSDKSIEVGEPGGSEEEELWKKSDSTPHDETEGRQQIDDTQQGQQQQYCAGGINDGEEPVKREVQV